MSGAMATYNLRMWNLDPVVLISMMKHFEIKFKYADSYSDWEWRNQKCSVYADNIAEAKSECIKLYGLGTDCDYEFVSVVEI